MKFLKTVGSVVLGCVLIGMVTYEVSRVKSNLDNGADSAIAAFVGDGQESRKVVSEKAGILSDEHIQAMSALVELNCTKLTNEYDITVRSEYIQPMIHKEYNVEFGEYDIYVQGNVYKKVYITTLNSEIKVVYNDGTETTLEDLFNEVEDELMVINETAKIQIENMINNTSLTPEEIVEGELPNDLFGSAGDVDWHQAVEPLGDAGFETNMSENDTMMLMKEAFPNAIIELLEVRDLDYVFSVISNTSGNPEDNVYAEYTVPNNFPEIYDMSGNCIYTK